VRGWGAEVEVIAPASMREELAQEAREMMDVYFPQ
jgi:predicted DNA-binding transcriptional regulator YafY